MIGQASAWRALRALAPRIKEKAHIFMCAQTAASCLSSSSKLFVSQADPVVITRAPSYLNCLATN
ncbi:MAG: hypothetical protein EBZ03_05225 [Betaproteobacteria bacterium]|nr:hypothetical protein [Betaproteobacteria bacterium]NBO44123.1 hypothetical protein [Betaproteobacteria bacterium]NBP09900.1 hypothetical protein [Betaproteobacteria bacterium]NBP61663.1 hypothetical protein [Betaproteobacteria bacterium]NBQ10113.1 hypothetical protein [Betaproteobacteria bacterium]